MERWTQQHAWVAHIRSRSASVLDVSAHLLLLSDNEAEVTSRIPLVWGPRSQGIPPQYKRALLWPPDHHSFCLGEGFLKLILNTLLHMLQTACISYYHDEMVSIHKTHLDSVTCFWEKGKRNHENNFKVLYTLLGRMSTWYNDNFSQLDTMLIFSIMRLQRVYLYICFSIDSILNGYAVIFLAGRK